MKDFTMSLFSGYFLNLCYLRTDWYNIVLLAKLPTLKKKESVKGINKKLIKTQSKKSVAITIEKFLFRLRIFAFLFVFLEEQGYD